MPRPSSDEQHAREQDHRRRADRELQGHCGEAAEGRAREIPEVEPADLVGLGDDQPREDESDAEEHRRERHGDDEQPDELSDGLAA